MAKESVASAGDLSRVEGAGFPGLWFFTFFRAEGDEIFDGHGGHPHGVAGKGAGESLEAGFDPVAVPTEIEPPVAP
ncbi:MAG: hypothetical protein ACYC1D_04780 [Acidimicrobiales bacterium]